ncbi:MAG: hypothetical protein C4296_01675 [Gemmataceae bacterium]
MDALIFTAAVSGLAACWFIWCVIMAHLSGWARLAGRYRATYRPQGPFWTIVAGAIGWCGYKGLELCVASEGLYLEAPFILRPWHPPLLIPWSDLRVEAVTDKWWRRSLHLAVGDPPVARLRLPLKVADAIEQFLHTHKARQEHFSGQQLPGE